MKQENWIFYTDVDFYDKSILQYHVDTRDFHVLINGEKPDQLPDLQTLTKYKDRFFYTDKEVAELIDRYFKESGGVKEWRLFMLEGYRNWGLKYLRFYRTEYGMILVDSDKKAVKREVAFSPVLEDE